MSAVRVAGWAAAMDAASADVPTEQYLSALLALRPAWVRERLVRLLQQRRASATEAMETFGIPQPVAKTVAALAALDPALLSLPALIDTAIDRAFSGKRGTAVRLETTRPLPAAMLDTLGRSLPAPVVIDQQVTPRLLEGVRITVGSTRIDRTAQARLAELRRTVQS